MRKNIPKPGVGTLYVSAKNEEDVDEINTTKKKAEAMRNDLNNNVKRDDICMKQPRSASDFKEDDK